MQPPPAYIYQPQQWQPDVVYLQPPPQQIQILQIAPPPERNSSPRSGRRYSATGGLLSTGIMHLVIGVLSIALSGVTYATDNLVYLPYGIWSGILFYIPAGILGVHSRSKRTDVMTGYLVMGVLSSLEALAMLVLAGVWAGTFSLDSICLHYCDYYYHGCEELCRVKGATAIHSVLAVLALIEFFVSIIGAAYCCRGLTCCCASPIPADATTPWHITYQNQPDRVALPPE